MSTRRSRSGLFSITASGPVERLHHEALELERAEAAKDGVTDRLPEAKEVAELLSVPVGWVREHTRTGAIPHVQLGRYVRYAGVDVLAWVESPKAGGGPSFRNRRPGSS